MAHVEYLVHLFPVSAGAVMDGLEERRYREHVVLHDLAVVTNEMQHLRLGATGAVDHSVDLRTQLVEELLDDGGIGTCRGEDELAGIDGDAVDSVGEFVLTTVDEVVGDSMVIALGIFCGKVFGKDIMTGTRQTVAAHAAIIAVLVGSLTGGGEADDDITGTDVGIIDDILTLHTAGNGGVDDDRTYEVADISRLTASWPDADAHATELGEELIGAVDDGRDDFSRDKHLVTADGGGDEDVIHGTDAQQVIGVHDDGILRDTFPHAQVAGLLPVHISEGGFRAGTIGMHDVTILGISTEDIGDNLTESLREDTLVYILDGVMHIFLCGRDAAHHISVIHFRCFYLFSCQNSQLAKAWSRSISRPFLTVAPCSRPFFMKSVSSGL